MSGHQANNRRQRGTCALSPVFTPTASGQQVSHLVVGQIVAARGVQGEVKVRIESEQPERFYALKRVYLGEGLHPFQIRRARLHKGQALLQLGGIDGREAAEEWVGAYVYVHVDDALPLEKGQYYFFQIQGLEVRTADGERLGRIVDILATGANDVYVIRGAGQEILLPAIPEVILEVDLEQGTMTVQLIPGLR